MKQWQRNEFRAALARKGWRVQDLHDRLWSELGWEGAPHLATMYRHLASKGAKGPRDPVVAKLIPKLLGCKKGDLWK